MKTSAMKCIVLVALLSLNCADHAQSQEPDLLRGAVHCLAAKKFLPPTRVEKGTFGVLLDEKSYPGKKMLYVVDYLNRSRSNGFAFTLFLTDGDGHQNLDIQNNARFALSKNLDGGVSYEAPPLGGTWTREHLASAIRQIEKQPKAKLSEKDIFAADSAFSCTAYTDPEVKTAQ